MKALFLAALAAVGITGAVALDAWNSFEQPVHGYCPDDVVAVPEPGSMALIAFGLLVLLVARRTR